MIDLGQHAEYIVWGYLGVAVGTLSLVGWILFDSRRTAALLKDLDSRGIRRRSSTGETV